MIDLKQIAEGKRTHSLDRASKLRDADRKPAAVVSAYQPFSAHVLAEAQRYASHGLPPAFGWLPLAHPTLFLRGLAGLAFAKKKGNNSGSREAPADTASTYLGQAGEMQGAEFVNLIPDNIKRVGIFHTVAVMDGLALLADIGRGARFAHALALPLHAMLAPTSWVCANRSVFRIVGHELIRGGGVLTSTSVEDLLDLNTTQRSRLYAALGIQATVEEIPAYDQIDSTIKRGTLEKIAEYYTRLAQTVFGLSGDLDRDQLKLVGAKDTGEDERLPESIRVLHNANLLEGASGKADLIILRTVAKHFSCFSIEVFIYYFAQYFGQLKYSGNTLKTAVATEKRFDGALHDHTLHIHQRWGNGGIPPGEDPLAAAYDQQYALGPLDVLPYTPISLGVVQALREGGDLPELLKGVCALRLDQSVADLANILKNTDAIALNRLMADLTSFLLLCQRQSPDALQDACRTAGLKDGMNGIFGKLGIEESWRLETLASAGAETVELWRGWLNMVENTSQLMYTPPHLWFILQDSWQDEAYPLLANLALVAKNFYNLVTQRNWVKGA